MHRNHNSNIQYISPPSRSARVFIPKSDSLEAQAASKILLLKEEKLLAEHEQMDKRFSAGSLASLRAPFYLGCRTVFVLTPCDCLCVSGVLVYTCGSKYLRGRATTRSVRCAIHTCPLGAIGVVACCQLVIPSDATSKGRGS